jgi:alpha-D-xyloside xylohydrolase
MVLFFLLQMNALGSEGNNEIIAKIKSLLIRIEVITPSIVRISESSGKQFSDIKSLIIQPATEGSKFQKLEDNKSIKISTDSLLIILSKKNDAITFCNKKNKIILKTIACDTASFIQANVQNEKTFHVKQAYKISGNEALYGLGQFEDPIMNYRNQDILIVQANRTAVNPFLVSTNGYGLLWDNYSKTKFHEAKDTMYFWSEVADQIDYYFIYGPTIDEEISGYRELTGKAPLYGKWAYGYWQSKERYQTSSELIKVVSEYRKRKIPLDNIVQDWQYWGDMEHFSGMIWDSIRYPHPELFIDSLHNLNVHLMVSIWPAFGPKTEIYKEMASNNFLFNENHWSGGKVYDAYNPNARKIYWHYIENGLFRNGVDAFWMDGSEPEFRCTDDRYITEISIKDAGKNYLGTNSSYLNTFSLETTKGVYDHQRNVNDKKRVFILTRSTFAGQQKYAAATWSGDTFASWQTLKTQIAAGINFSMSGLPYWTNDIGGFITSFNYPNALNDDAYKELYVRWFEFGTFCPIFRSHGTDIPREIWQYGNKGDWAYDALVKFDKLRYRLMPYIYSLAWKVTNDNYTIMRGLVMNFPMDKNTYSVSNQFMFGPSLMITPVTKPIYHLSQYMGVDITPQHFYSENGKEHGTKLKIYKGTDFNELIFSRKFEASQIGWIGCLPQNLDTSYSLMINGMVKTEKSGKYKFFVLTDAGVKLWINNKLIIDKWDNKDTNKFEGYIVLKRNTKYNFRIFHSQFRKNSAYLKINWITPNVDKNPNKVEVYLPKNNLWYNFWTGKTQRGGKNILVSTPIDMIPIYIPSGSIIPMGTNIQYAAQKSKTPLELRIYPGKDGSFQLYEDESDNYDYEKGLYSTILFSWNDKDKILTIGKRKGEFPGMLKDKLINVVIVKDHHGIGDENTTTPDKAIKYEGSKIKIKF